ncbi:MAG: hypothetical protein Q7S05_02215 [bacterium]|nr:hypothetical protein [bacterium]
MDRVSECWYIVHILCTMNETGRHDMGSAANYLVDRLIRVGPQGIYRREILEMLAAHVEVLKVRRNASARDVESHLRRAIEELERSATPILAEADDTIIPDGYGASIGSG